MLQYQMVNCTNTFQQLTVRIALTFRNVNRGRNAEFILYAINFLSLSMMECVSNGEQTYKLTK